MLLFNQDAKKFKQSIRGQVCSKIASGRFLSEQVSASQEASPIKKVINMIQIATIPQEEPMEKTMYESFKTRMNFMKHKKLK